MTIDALTQGQAAQLLGKTARTLRAWESNGEGVPRNDDGTYPGPELVAWFVRRSTAQELDGRQEKARRDKESADKLALENARTRGELADIAQIAEWYGGHVDRATTRLEQIPDSLGQMVEPRIAAVVVPECRRLIHEACNEIAAAGVRDGNGAGA